MPVCHRSTSALACEVNTYLCAISRTLKVYDDSLHLISTKIPGPPYKMTTRQKFVWPFSSRSELDKSGNSRICLEGVLSGFIASFMRNPQKERNSSLAFTSVYIFLTIKSCSWLFISKDSKFNIIARTISFGGKVSTS